MKINEDFIDDIDIQEVSTEQPETVPFCKYGFGLAYRIKEPDRNRYERLINQLMDRFGSITEHYFEWCSQRKREYTGPASRVSFSNYYDGMVMFNGEMKPTELFALVEQLLKLINGNYEILAAIICMDREKDDYENFIVNKNSTLKSIMAMFDKAQHNRHIYDIRKTLPKLFIQELSLMSDYEQSSFAEAYIKRYNVCERMALSISYNGFDSMTVDCSMLNNLPIVSQEPFGHQRYLRVEFEDIEKCVFDNDSPDIRHYDYQQLPNSFKNGNYRLRWCSGALNPTSRYITFVAYVRSTRTDSFFVYMNLLKTPMMVAEFKEAMSEITGLTETDDRIQ